MKSSIALLVVVFSFSAAMLVRATADDKPFWHSDWPTAQRIAKGAGKPIFAVFVCRH